MFESLRPDQIDPQKAISEMKWPFCFVGFYPIFLLNVVSTGSSKLVSRYSSSLGLFHYQAVNVRGCVPNFVAMAPHTCPACLRFLKSLVEGVLQISCAANPIRVVRRNVSGISSRLRSWFFSRLSCSSNLTFWRLLIFTRKINLDNGKGYTRHNAMRQD